MALTLSRIVASASTLRPVSWHAPHLQCPFCVAAIDPPVSLIARLEIPLASEGRMTLQGRSESGIRFVRRAWRLLLFLAKLRHRASAVYSIVTEGTLS